MVVRYVYSMYACTVCACVRGCVCLCVSCCAPSIVVVEYHCQSVVFCVVTVCFLLSTVCVCIVCWVFAHAVYVY